MKYLLSAHAGKEHNSDKWNAKTILDAYLKGRLKDTELLVGRTADVLYGYTNEGACVGLILSKPEGDTYVVVTGFSAPADYWKSV